MHSLHIGFSLFTLPELDSEDIASLRQKCDLLLIFYLFLPILFPAVGDSLVQVLTALTSENACEGLMREGQVSSCCPEVS